MSVQACCKLRYRKTVTWLPHSPLKKAETSPKRQRGLLVFGPGLRGGLVFQRTAKPHAGPRVRLWLLTLIVLPATFVPCRGVQAQDEEEQAVVVDEVVFTVTDSQFDQWVFQQHRTAIRARKHMNTQLALQAEDVDRVCELTDAQQKKLRLAGRGDIKRFFDRYEKIKQKFQLLKKDRQKINHIWQDISPLQTTLRAGLFHDDSFLHKSLRNTLTDEQFARYATVARDRRKFRHRAKIELVVAMLEQGMPLKDEQRRKLITLLVNETKPPRKSGRYDYYVIMFQISRLAERKLRPLLDDTQWKVLNRQLDRARGMEQFLRRSGHLPDDDDDDEDHHDET